MIAIPLVVIVILNFTANTVAGFVPVAVDSIVMTESTKTAKVGESFALDVKFEPENASNKNLVWTSDNENVATVDNKGNVLFVGYGKCYITATSEDGNKKASCYFYIYDTVARELDFYSPKETINVEEVVEMKATIYPIEAENKEIEYFSYDQSIGTINQNGFFTAIKPGYVTLSATAVETGITKFLSVLVVKPVESIIIDEESVVISEMDYQIKAKTLPHDATQTDLIYTSSDLSVASVTKRGAVSFLKAGKVTITIEDQNRTIKKTIEITSTAGFVQDLLVDKSYILTSLSDAPVFVGVSVYPQSIELNNLEIINENPDVCYLDDAFYIQPVSTGSTTITIRAQKNKDEWIETKILVDITYPAEDIVINDIFYCAQSSIKLTPKSFPDISTNRTFFYEVLQGDIQVDEDGLVTKNAQGVVEAEIMIYANEKDSEVRKSTKIIFTDGYSTDVEFSEQDISINVGDSYIPSFKFLPQSSIAKELEITIKEQFKNAQTDDVAIISSDVIVGMFGGSVVVEYKITHFDDTQDVFTQRIDVVQKTQSIEIECELDVENSVYVTGQPTFDFTFKTLPKDATNTKIEFFVESGPAVIVGQSVKFNSRGTAKIVGQSADKNASVSIYVKYTGPNPISATLSPLPEIIYVGDVFEIEVLSCFPTNAMNTNISYEINNHSTASIATNKVLVVEGSKLKAVAGGTCMLTVHVAANFQKTYEIQVIRLPENIVVYPSNIQTTASVVNLTSTILPYDTTDKTIEYSCNNPEIATLQNAKLTFLQNGIVEIEAKCLADPSITYTFTIEKIDKAASTVTPQNKNVSVKVGEKIIFDPNQFCTNFATSEIVVENDEILRLGSSNTITAIQPGSTKVNIYFYDQNGVIVQHSIINVQVVVLIEDFSVLKQLDNISGEYQTAVALVDLTTEVQPENSTNKTIEFEIIESFSNTGEKLNNIAYIQGQKLEFMQSGIVVIRASTQDESEISKLFRVRFTGGNATRFELNVEPSITMNIGDEVEIVVSKWIPANTVNKQLFIESSSSSANIINLQGNKITAMGGGNASVTVETSNGLAKIINIIVQKAATDLVVEKQILTSKTEYTIYAKVLPEDATTKDIKYTLKTTDVASLNKNKLTFFKAGKVEVEVICADITKTVFVESTFGELLDFEVNVNEVRLLKNSQQLISISSHLPQDLELDKNTAKYQIIENEPQGMQGDVVELAGSVIKAKMGGNATVRVSFELADGTSIYQDINVTVIQHIETIEVEFDRTLDKINDTFIVGKSSIGFSISAKPLDAAIRQTTFDISNPENARIENNEIKFLKEGRVSIVISLVDVLNNVASKTFSFYYTAGKLLQVAFDSALFVDGVRQMNAGESFNIKFTQIIPSDIDVTSIFMIDKIETKNDDSKSVISFDGNKITALAGGVATFKFNICSYVSQTFKVVVNQPATSISTQTNVYVSSPEYQIKWNVLPSDANNKEVNFKSLDTTVATVNSAGRVVFNKFGQVNIVVEVKNDDTISRTISIEYSNSVKRIEFKDVPDSVFIGGYLQFSIQSFPYGCEAFNVIYSISSKYATITQYGKMYAGDKAEDVIVRAEVEGNSNVFVEKTIKIKSLITDIELELDGNDDKRGIGEYTVYGHLWIKDDGTVVNAYEMKIKSIQPADANDELVWTSSNTEIATVNNSGRVVFTGKAGMVTITVRPLNQLTDNENRFLKDSYTFNVIQGVNIYTKSQFVHAMSRAEAVVFQDNIKYDTPGLMKVTKNMHGNGYLLDMSMSREGYGAGYHRLKIEKSGVIIDNIQLRAASFGENSSLTELEGLGSVLWIENRNITDPNQKLKDIVVKNSIMENASIAVKVYGADVTFTGCVIRNSFSAGLLFSNTYQNMPSNITIRDCIFKAASLGSMMFDPAQSTVNSENVVKNTSKLIFEDDLIILNWLDIDQISGKTIAEILGTATEQLRDLFRSQTKFVKHINGKDYFMAGMIALKAGYEGVFEYDSKINVDMTKISSKYRYEPFNIEGNITIGPVPVPFTMAGYTLSSGEQTLLPDTEIDTTMLKSIKQPQ